MTYITLLESSLNSTNQLINGGMEIWQRGVSFTNPSATAYTADRWQMNHNGVPVLTVTRESTITDSSPFSFKWNMSGVGGGTVFRMRQTVEQANQLAGKTVTFAARVRVDSGGGGYVFVDMNDTNGSTPFNAWNATTLSGTSTWETIYVTRTLAANVTSLNVQFNFNNTPGVCYIDNLTLVIGSQPMGYVPLQPQQELALCQRYYEIGNFADTKVIQRDNPGTPRNRSRALIRFVAEKRVVPTMTTTLVSANLCHLPTTGSAESSDTGNWTISSAPTTTSNTATLTRNADQTTFPILEINHTWTASADY